MIPKSKILTPSYQNPKTEEGKKKRKKKKGIQLSENKQGSIGN